MTPLLLLSLLPSFRTSFISRPLLGQPRLVLVCLSHLDRGVRLATARLSCSIRGPMRSRLQPLLLLLRWWYCCPASRCIQGSAMTHRWLQVLLQLLLFARLPRWYASRCFQCSNVTHQWEGLLPPPQSLLLLPVCLL